MEDIMKLFTEVFNGVDMELVKKDSEPQFRFLMSWNELRYHPKFAAVFRPCVVLAGGNHSGKNNTCASSGNTAEEEGEVKEESEKNKVRPTGRRKAKEELDQNAARAKNPVLQK